MPKRYRCQNAYLNLISENVIFRSNEIIKKKQKKKNKWADSWQNQQNGLSAQSDQSLRCALSG